MKYFKDYLGTVTYEGNETVNIFKRIIIDIDDNSEYLIDYVIKDGESPESISYNLYDTTDLWWTIMVINDRFDRFFHFPIPNKILTDYLDWLVEEGEITAGDTASINQVITENDNRRAIKVVDPKYIRQLLYQVQQELEA